MSARFIEPVDRAQAERLSGFVNQALEALDTALDIPLRLVDRDGSDRLRAPDVMGWANADGVWLARDLLPRPDEDVREVVVEEVGHYYVRRVHPCVANSELLAELFGCWLVCRVCGTATVLEHPTDDRYWLGKFCGAALADGTLKANGRKARDELAEAGYTDLVEMIDRLDGSVYAHPQQLAAQLVAEVGGR